MSRILQVVGLTFVLTACSPETPSQPPMQASQPAFLPHLPERWNLDAPLPSRVVPECRPDSITAETIAFVKRDVELEFTVRLDAAGKVRGVSLAAGSRPSDPHVRLIKYAEKCLALITFAEPPQQPYEMNTTVKFPARKHSWPEWINAGAR